MSEYEIDCGPCESVSIDFEDGECRLDVRIDDYGMTLILTPEQIEGLLGVLQEASAGQGS